MIRIKITVPESVFDDAKAIDRIVRAQRNKTGPDIRRMFRGTTEGWKNKPDWSQVQTIGANRIAVRVTPSGNYASQYILVNQGARPHDIRPRRSRLLRFQRGYRSATRPRLLRSRAASRFGPFVGAAAVSHPGFEPRQFDDEIAKQYADTFADDMQEAIGG